MNAARPSGPPARGRPVVVIANPAARGFRAKSLAAFVQALETGGCAVVAHITGGPGEIAALAAALPPGTDTLVVAGGDGSIREAVTGLLAWAPPRPVLGVLPAGTANVLAQELALPRRPAAAAAVVLTRRLVPLHLGIAGGRPFVLMASAGFDAAVVARVGVAAKKRLGIAAYALQAGRGVITGGSPSFTVTADGQTIEAGIAVAAKVGHYGGAFRLTRATGATVPGLRLVTIGRAGPATLIRAGSAMLFGRLPRSPILQDRAASEIRFETPGIPVQIDGDPAGVTPLDIRASAETVEIIIP